MSETKVKEVIQAFIERDENAVQEFNNEFAFTSPPIEARLAFVESRLIDLCNVVTVLSNALGETIVSHP